MIHINKTHIITVVKNVILINVDISKKLYGLCLAHNIIKRKAGFLIKKLLISQHTIHYINLNI